MNFVARKLKSSVRAGVVCAALVAAKAQAAEEPAPSRVHALVNFEFSDKYVTPRGMIVQDKGLVFQPLVLGFANLYKGDSFLTDFTAVGGVWNCFGTSDLPSSDSGGASGTSWYEIDPIAGISVGIAKKLTLDLTYTAFNMQILSIPLSQHFEAKLSFDDSEYLGAFALHPYVSYWRELDNKATAARVPFLVKPAQQTGPGSFPDESFYFDVGVSPSYTFKNIGLKLEAPCR